MVKDYQDLQCLEVADESYKNEKGLPAGIMTFPRPSSNSRILLGLFALCALSILILIIIVAVYNSNTKQMQKTQQEDLSNFTQSVKSEFGTLDRKSEAVNEKIKEVDTALEKLRTDNSREVVQMKVQLQELKDTIKNLKCEVHNLKTNGSGCCPFGWPVFSGSCYYISKGSNTWVDSRKHCITEDAHLVVINTKAEQEYIQTKTIPDFYWLGLTDVGGTWKWVDGTSYASTPTNWSPGQPDKFYGHGLEGAEACAHLQHNGQWNDDYCSSLYKWVCEKEIN
ncbi:asialoglycoprotein receptor 1 isoform X2 [Microcaecilia unicolor]|uniref:Asialoglycoprotein receptor 1-like isoform X2 n=1 Tax=Microcaecilia unicolor TaxID=1415580 RepID=A0A6P7WSU3_9AMPH|nr:asialoglycoprotein receptor 1-like isoform X2 [Microcaecilia unicolor]